MTYAAITGWGKCLPPAVLSNDDLATFLDTDDTWITSRTGMKERRISHVPAVELSYVASRRALACAGLAPTDIDLIVYGSCSYDEMVPNTASGLQYKLGATGAAAMDVNTACTSFLYAWSTANAMIRTGVVRRALIIGVELISRYLDWEDRAVAVLFGDGAAAIVIEATEERTGLLAESLGCFGEARGILRIGGYGATYANVEFQHLAEYYALFLLVDWGAAVIAFLVEPREEKQLTWLIFLQRFAYRQVMYWVVLKAFASAFRGRVVGWGKLERKATVTVQAA